MPIRIAPVTSFSSAQRPVSSNSSSQRVSCFGSSVLPRVRRVVTTSVRVGGGGLLWRWGGWGSLGRGAGYPPPRPLPPRGGGTGGVRGPPSPENGVAGGFG